MATAVIRVPKIGISMTEATLVEWFAADGEAVEAGQTLYALEMDKATNEITAPLSGKLEIIGEVGEIYQVGDLIGKIITG
ncbi:dihydrolipoamide acyltransferase [Sphingopyxis sp. YF1]|uniref:lipoyl domain-containing protein n=1 Tax=Sphingopyxis sp. YF1 TaxID=2482763 RepID=UPI0024161917|nr:lipoyl domain-containing protein [Sphingopyxis sp. YF1]UNU43721.1 dihydrolipoamide acyltransferase [Sphingopyxis sp. YF1]